MHQALIGVDYALSSVAVKRSYISREYPEKACDESPCLGVIPIRIFRVEHKRGLTAGYV